MRAYTQVWIWRAYGNNRKCPHVPYPIEVRIGDNGSDGLSIQQARTLIRQLERTIKEVQCLRGRK